MTSQEEKINWWKRLNTPYYTPLGTGGLMVWMTLVYWDGWFRLIGAIVVAVIFTWSLYRDYYKEQNE